MSINKGYTVISEYEELYYKGNDPVIGKPIPIKRMELMINYLTMAGSIESRNAALYIPINSCSQYPLIISVHYEINESDGVLYEFLKRGWAVLTPICIPDPYLADIVSDDLRFNMALLNLSRRLECIDKTRIALRGGSAGGYQTMMLSANHFGILCAYNMSGVLNLSYQFQYLLINNQFNLDFAKTLPESEQSDPNVYPIPGVKLIYDAFLPTAKAIGIEDMESELWFQYSPVFHLDEICHPVLMIHSTADLIVPIYQITERDAHKKFGKDLPETFRIHLNQVVKNESIAKPMDELVPEEDIIVYIKDPAEQKTHVEMIKFDPKKRFSITLIDEGPVERMCSHVKDPKNIFVSEMAFFEYYFSQKISRTNLLNQKKLEVLAKRYIGSLLLFLSENQYKENTPPEVFGSLFSDRLDVLLSIADYLGLQLRNEKRKVLVDGVSTTITFVYENLKNFIHLYQNLADDMKFLDIDNVPIREDFETDPIGTILRKIQFYAEKCNFNMNVMIH